MALEPAGPRRVKTIDFATIDLERMRRRQRRRGRGRAFDGIRASRAQKKSRRRFDPHGPAATGDNRDDRLLRPGRREVSAAARARISRSSWANRFITGLRGTSGRSGHRRVEGRQADLHGRLSAETWRARNAVSGSRVKERARAGSSSPDRRRVADHWGRRAWRPSARRSRAADASRSSAEEEYASAARMKLKRPLLTSWADAHHSPSRRG